MDELGFNNACFVLTGVCNERCIFCFRPENGVFFNFSFVNDAVKFLKSMKVRKVNLTGGEPTLHPQVVEIARKLKENGFIVSLTTNATTFRPEIMEFLDYISFSIESLDSRIVETLGRTPSYIENVEKYLSLADRKGIPVKINTLLCSLNASRENVEKIADWISSHKCIKRWKLFKFIPLRLSKDKEYLKITNKEFLELFHLGKKRIKIRGANVAVYVSREEDAYLLVMPDGRLVISKDGEDREIARLTEVKNEGKVNRGSFKKTGRTGTGVNRFNKRP